MVVGGGGVSTNLLFTAWGTAGILGPIVGARASDTTGDYGFAFYVAAGLAQVALAALAAARPPRVAAEVAAG